jgi:hypothetical protein
MGSAALLPVVSAQPWQLPRLGLALFEGDRGVPRLSHYFLPNLIQCGKPILFLDGANCADPRKMAKLAARRGIPFSQFSHHIQIARAFTCFQLTELIARVPQFMTEFPAEVLMVTAFPELYFDQDIRDWDARAAFEQALHHLRRWASQDKSPLTVAVFTSAPHFAPPPARRILLTQARAAANELWKFEAGAEGKLTWLQQPQHSGEERSQNRQVQSG